MERVDYESMVIQDLINAEKRDELDIAPWYQRRSVWSRPQKAYLINTIVSGKPVPTIYIRHRLDVEKERSIKEVVDGQQRIRAILEFRNDEFAFRDPVKKKRFKFSQLGKSEREAFLMTKLSVGYLIGANDGDVIDIFGRINSVSKTLNDQERRNAAFSGEFKQFCLSESSKRVSFWRETGIFTANDIARMQEVKFVSELAQNVMNGLSDSSAKGLDKLYEEYDDEFANWPNLEKKFDSVFARIEDAYGNRLKDTIFKRQPLFFSLFLALDAKPNATSAKISKAIKEIDERFLADQPANRADSDFKEASVSTTQRIAQRRVRDKYIKSFL